MARRVALICGIVAASAASTAMAEAIPPVEATWYLGPRLPAAVGPGHYDLDPSPSEVVFLDQRMIWPNVLVRTDREIDIGSQRQLPAGTHLFRLSYSKIPTFCTVVPAYGNTYPCLVDTNKDGKVDAVIYSKSKLDAIPVLFSDGRGMQIKPADLQSIPREQCRCQYKLSVRYLGRRTMFERGWSFDVAIVGNNANASKRETTILAKSIPDQLNIETLQLKNIASSGKNIQFDLSGELIEGPTNLGMDLPRGE